MSTRTLEQILQHEIQGRRRGRLYLAALLVAIGVVIAGLVVAI